MNYKLTIFGEDETFKKLSTTRLFDCIDYYVTRNDLRRKVYALTVDGEIIKYSSGTERISWGFTTKEFNDASFNNKVTTKIRLRMKIEHNSLVKVYIRYNQGAWELKDTYTNFDNDDYKTTKIVLAPQRHQIFQIKVECKGNSIIWGEREVYEVSDRNVKT